MPDPLGSGEALRGVLRLRGFRRVWYATALSSLGDWLGLLATTALAASLATSYEGQNYALGLVLVVRLLPSVVLGPLAGAFADRFDRRRTMVISDLLRFVLFLAIPLSLKLDIGNDRKLLVLYVASFLVECVSLFWNPAKDASVPNLVGRKHVEAANQLGLITTYGLTPVAAAGLFSALALATDQFSSGAIAYHPNQVLLSLYFNAATFVVAAAVIYTVREISGAHERRAAADSQPGLFAMLGEGITFLSSSKLLRGVIVGILGAFAAGGGVIGAGHTYVTSLGGGNAAYGVLFGAVFVGLGLGMAAAPKFARRMPRRLVFGLAIVFAGACLVLTSLAPQVILAMIVVVGVGFGGGVAFLSGLTLLGTEISDDMRGRVFAFIQSLVRVVLILSLAAVPFVVGWIGQPSLGFIGAHVVVDGTRIVLAAGGLLAALAGFSAYRLMDDRGKRPARFSRRGGVEATNGPGVLIAFEGGEGSGKSTQINALAESLRADGVAVEVTFEPGATPAGSRIRAIVLESKDSLDDRAEALLFAADRANHVATMIRPALESGRVVLTDRFVDSSLAYQGAGRALSVDEVRRLSKWATGDLVPDLTVVLDIPVADGLARAARRSTADRLESESTAFHQRVRDAFRSYADKAPERYLVVDARLPREAVLAEIRAAVGEVLESAGIVHHPAPRPVDVAASAARSELS